MTESYGESYTDRVKVCKTEREGDSVREKERERERERDI